MADLMARVSEALANAKDNGYDFDGLTHRQVAQDMITFVAELEDEDIDLVEDAIKNAWVEKAKKYTVWARNFRPTKKSILRIAVGNELWYRVLKSGDRRLYSVIGLDFEQDAEDPSLKLYVLTIFTLQISFGWV